MIYFLLCAYNEEKNIEKVITSISEKFVDKEIKIIVIDDGSVDNTKDIIKKIELTNKKLVLISHKKNLGLGCALKTGFEYLFSTIADNDIIITLDADNTHPIEVSQKMLTKISDGYDIVISSRYEKDGKQIGVNVLRSTISFLAKILLKKIFSFDNVKDYTSGYRAYSGKVIKKAKNFYGKNFIQEKDFVVQLEILYKLTKFNPKIVEVPLVLRYDKKYGKSKLKIIKNILKYLHFIFKTKFL
jgi:dolichol-phosphate mannosyltransferase